jgi:hypothetical protein
MGVLVGRVLVVSLAVVATGLWAVDVLQGQPISSPESSLPVGPIRSAQPASHHAVSASALSVSAVRAFTDGVVLVAADSGSGTARRSHVLVSTDDGGTFTDITPKALGTSSALHVDDLVARGPSRLWVLGWNVDSTHSTLFRSADGGHRWQAAPAPGHNLAAGSTNSLTFDDSRRGWLVRQEPNGPVNTLYATDDGGAEWLQVGGRAPRSAPVVSDDATGLWQGGGFFGGRAVRSSDGGRTWSTVGPAPHGERAPEAGRTEVFAGRAVAAVSTVTGHGETLHFYSSADAGRSWRLLSRLGPLRDEPIINGHPRRAETAFVTPRSWWVIAADPQPTVYTTNDAGRSWQRHRLPWTGPTPRASGLRLTASGPRHAWVLFTTGTGTSRLLATTDGGDHWVEMHPDQLTGRPMQPRPASVPTCRSRELTPRVAVFGSMASQPFVTITLRNHGSRTCKLRGYPGVEVVGHGESTPDSGMAVDLRRGSIYERSDPGPHRVLLRPGALASFNVGTGTAYDGGRDLLTLTRLIITPPGNRATVSLAVQMHASRFAGRPIPVGVTAVARGPGG